MGSPRPCPLNYGKDPLGSWSLEALGSKFLEYGDVNLFESPGQHGEPATPQRPQNPVIFSTLEVVWPLRPVNF